MPLAQRIPPLELKPGVEMKEAVSIHGGGVESYDFHGLEVLQSMIESRKGGESGPAFHVSYGLLSAERSLLQGEFFAVLTYAWGEVGEGGLSQWLPGLHPSSLLRRGQIPDPDPSVAAPADDLAAVLGERESGGF